MKTCRVLISYVNGDAKLCGKPAIQYWDQIPVCLEHLKIARERQKA